MPHFYNVGIDGARARKVYQPSVASTLRAVLCFRFAAGYRRPPQMEGL
jgi:hypothetical protein